MAKFEIIRDIIFYGIFLWIAVSVISFIVSIIKNQSCCMGPLNAYERFENADPISSHIYTSMTTMNATLDANTQNLQDTIASTGSMKAQTCSIYNDVQDKFIKTKAAEVADQSEYQLPKAQQQLLQKTRGKTAEATWKNQIELYLYRHHNKGILDCTKVVTQPTLEGFDDLGQIATTTLENLSQTLQGKIKLFSQLLDSPVVVEWLADCGAIEGTANYLNMYINNTQIRAEIEKCKADYTKGIKDFQSKSEEDQNRETDKANIACNLQYGPRLENFQDAGYANNLFSFPVPFPTTSLSPEQIGYYKVLSAGQDALTKFSTKVGNVYKTASAAYTRMNATNNTYITYMKQIDGATNQSTYTKNQAESLKS
jgi:hypothetical protein